MGVFKTAGNYCQYRMHGWLGILVSFLLLFATFHTAVAQGGNNVSVFNNKKLVKYGPFKVHDLKGLNNTLSLDSKAGLYSQTDSAKTALNITGGQPTVLSASQQSSTAGGSYSVSNNTRLNTPTGNSVTERQNELMFTSASSRTGVQETTATKNVSADLERFYHVRIQEQDRVALDLPEIDGLQKYSSASDTIWVSESSLQSMQDSEIPFTVLGGMTRYNVSSGSLGDDDNDVDAASGETEASEMSPSSETGMSEINSGTLDRDIPDDGWTYYGIRDSDGAPDGAVTTNLAYRLRIYNKDDASAMYCGDYEIYLSSTAQGGGTPHYLVYDNLGSRTDGGYDDDSDDDYDIYLNRRTTSHFNGEDPNQYWYVYIKDTMGGDTGYLQYIEWDVYWEYETLLPDLTNPSVASQSATAQEGESFYVRALVKNAGEASASSSSTRAWLSTDNDFDTSDDHALGVKSVPSLGVGSETWVQWDFTMPNLNGADIGVCYNVWILCEVDYYDDIAESNEDNLYKTNNALFEGSDPIELPDLTNPSTAYQSATAREGEPFYIRSLIKNDGDTSAGASSARTWLSIDNDFDTSDDHALNVKSVPSLGAGSETWVQWDFTMPNLNGADIGESYDVWVLCEVDYYDDIVESDENNLYKTTNALFQGNDPPAQIPDIRVDPSSLSFNQTQPASTSLGAAGVTTTIENQHGTIVTSSEGITLNMEFPASSLTLEERNQFTMAYIPEGEFQEDLPGHPWLPARMINVLIPSGARVENLEVSADETLVASDVLIYPVQPSVPISLSDQAAQFVDPDANAYASTTKVPLELVELTGKHKMRGYSFVTVRLNPVRYIAGTRELYLATSMTIRLSYSLPPAPAYSPNGNNERFRDLIEDITINSSVLNERIEFSPQSTATITGDSPAALTDYLIITSPDLRDAFQALANHRNHSTGLTTTVLTTDTIYSDYSGSDNQERIRACIVDYVNNRGTVYVVLGGDDTVVPDRDCSVSANGETEANMPTDLYYSGLDSDWDEDGDGIYGEADTSEGDEGDLAADVFVGRIPVRTAAQATAYINKLIQFEGNPLDENSLIMLGEHLGSSVGYSPYSGDDRPSDTVDDGHLAFRSHSPVSDAEMWTRRLYRDSIQTNWEPQNLGFFFDTLTSWDGDTSGDYAQTDTNVRIRLDQGWYHVFMSTHGNPTSWSLESGSFNTADATAISGRLGIVYTIACLTGHFDGTTDPSLSESFLRDGEGPVAYFGCSRFGWFNPDSPPAGSTTRGGPSMEYAHDFYDRVLSNDEGLAESFYAHKASNAGSSGSNNSNRWIQFGLNYQGDPALGLPQNGRTQQLAIVNEGSANLVINSITEVTGSCWLSLVASATPFTITAGGTEFIQVEASSDCVGVGTYSDTIRISSNDPDEPNVDVPVSLQVSEALEPDLVVSEPVPDVSGPYVVGQTVDWDVSISNLGNTTSGESSVGYYVGTSCSDLSYRVNGDNVDPVVPGTPEDEHDAYTFKVQDVGTRYKIVKADYHEEVDEKNENNNTACYGPFIVGKAATTTTVTGDTPDPSTPGEQVLVSYTVAVQPPGSGTPTGNVTVSASTGASCSGTVAEGSCSLTLNQGGELTLTASYAGDGGYSASTSPSVAHTVVVAGDVDGDGSIDLGDVVRALQIATGNTGFPVNLDADVNGDGEIGIAEAVFCARAILSF